MHRDPKRLAPTAERLNPDGLGMGGMAMMGTIEARFFLGVVG